MTASVEHENVGATDALSAAIDACLALDDPSVGRLSYAKTSIRLRVGDDEGLTLLLDRRPPQLRGGEEPAEIEITLSDIQARLMARGELSIVTGLIAGEIHASGPVRKFMEIAPMLARLLRRASSEHGAILPVAEARGTRPVSEGESLNAALDPAMLAIETRDLHKAFGPNRILEGCNLKIPEGVISVILGPSGTGKSVMLQHIIGLMQADAGEVLIRGNPLSKMSRSEILSLRREIGVMFQDGALFSTMNVADNVAFPLRQHTNLAEDQIASIVDEQLADLGLSKAATLMPNELSGGMRKRAGLARSLVLDPGIVLCDEPDSGLDPVRTALLGDLLVEQHAEHGGTMIVVTHNVPLARQISDHVSVLWRGGVLESGLADDVFASETPFTKQFLASETAGPLSMDDA